MALAGRCALGHAVLKHRAFYELHRSCPEADAPAWGGMAWADRPELERFVGDLESFPAYPGEGALFALWSAWFGVEPDPELYLEEFRTWTPMTEVDPADDELVWSALQDQVGMTDDQVEAVIHAAAESWSVVELSDELRDLGFEVDLDELVALGDDEKWVDLEQLRGTVRRVADFITGQADDDDDDLADVPF